MTRGHTPGTNAYHFAANPMPPAVATRSGMA